MRFGTWTRNNSALFSFKFSRKRTFRIEKLPVVTYNNWRLKTSKIYENMNTSATMDKEGENSKANVGIVIKVPSDSVNYESKDVASILLDLNTMGDLNTQLIEAQKLIRETRKRYSTLRKTISREQTWLILNKGIKSYFCRKLFPEKKRDDSEKQVNKKQTKIDAHFPQQPGFSGGVNKKPADETPNQMQIIVYDAEAVKEILETQPTDPNKASEDQFDDDEDFAPTQFIRRRSRIVKRNIRNKSGMKAVQKTPLTPVTQSNQTETPSENRVQEQPNSNIPIYEPILDSLKPVETDFIQMQQLMADPNFGNRCKKITDKFYRKGIFKSTPNKEFQPLATSTQIDAPEEVVPAEEYESAILLVASFRESLLADFLAEKATLNPGQSEKTNEPKISQQAQNSPPRPHAEEENSEHCSDHQITMGSSLNLTQSALKEFDDYWAKQRVSNRQNRINHMEEIINRVNQWREKIVN